jgi:hypothetical protein
VTNELGFEFVSEITAVETIAAGKDVRDAAWLSKLYGAGRWRKLKGIASVRLPSGRERRVELHWYEAEGIGRHDFKIKRYLD